MGVKKEGGRVGFTKCRWQLDRTMGDKASQSRKGMLFFQRRPEVCRTLLIVAYRQAVGTELYSPVQNGISPKTSRLFSYFFLSNFDLI